MIWGQEYLLKEIKNGTEIIIKGEGFVPYTKKQRGDLVFYRRYFFAVLIMGRKDVYERRADS